MNETEVLVLVPLFTGLYSILETEIQEFEFDGFLSPYFRGSIRFDTFTVEIDEEITFSSPFLRGIFDHKNRLNREGVTGFSSPYLRGYIRLMKIYNEDNTRLMFSSPFLRSYIRLAKLSYMFYINKVLVLLFTGVYSIKNKPKRN